MKRRVFPVVIAVILIVVIAWGAISVRMNDKNAYGTDVMDLRTYFGVEEGKLIIFDQDQRLAEKALLRDGICYLNLNFVKTYVNNNFYYDRSEKRLLFTDAMGTFEAIPGETKYLQYGEEKEFQGQPCILEGDGLFLALSYVADLTDLKYKISEWRLQIIRSLEPNEVVTVTTTTKMRCQNDVKSEILCDVMQGEALILRDSLDKWSMVENDDGIVGYVENQCLGASFEVEPEVQEKKSDYVAPEYTANQLREKVCLGWHAIGGTGGNSTLGEMVADSRGMNVISPTWFSLNDNEGGFRSFAEASYVTKAHKYGLEVWAAFDDFNYEIETGENIDDSAIFSSTSKRTRLISKMIEVSLALELDGINLDFEKVGPDCSEHFGQFLRELSAECRKNSLKLSIDNYMPNEGNKQYRLDVQGQVADYVILMGYDEHWHGSGNPGSVASLGFISDGIEKSLAYVPAEKLVNAVPFYTILWKIQGAEVKDEYLTLVNEPDFIKRMGVEPVWDEVTCQNYMEWSSNGVTYKVWLEDQESISMKLNAMSNLGLAGVAAWRLGYGTQDVWTLLSMFKKM